MNVNLYKSNIAKCTKWIYNEYKLFACPKGKVLFKKKEEFVRSDPKSYSKYYLLRILNWLVPICVVAIGLFITTQKFAPMMNYDERVIGKPLIVLSNGYRIYNPGFLLLGIFKYASDKTYSHFFFEAFPPTGISLIIAFSLYFIALILYLC